MRPGEILALLMRHKLAVILVLVLAVGLLVDFKKTPPVYQETATVVFTSPVSTVNPNPYSSFGGNLVTAGDIILRILRSPASQQQVLAAGGSAAYSVQLVNLYNMEYPDYGLPYAEMAASSTSPAQAHQTFDIVTRQLFSILKSRQVLAKVHPVNRITIKLIGVSGPLPLQGSAKRSDAGLVLLTIIVLFSVVNGLDRRQRRQRAKSSGRFRAAHPEQALRE
jgi:uncharacterized protein involved in exopolysaccharide biosynthesis